MIWELSWLVSDFDITTDIYFTMPNHRKWGAGKNSWRFRLVLDVIIITALHCVLFMICSRSSCPRKCQTKETCGRVRDVYKKWNWILWWKVMRKKSYLILWWKVMGKKTLFKFIKNTNQRIKCGGIFFTWIYSQESALTTPWF